MKKINEVAFCLLLSFKVNYGLSQTKLESTAQNRIHLTRNDTTYVFYAEKKAIQAKSSKDYYWYVNDTILITSSGYGGRLLNGPYTVFYPNKNIKESGSFIYGLKDGEWKSWFETGKLKSIINWKNGKRQGDFYNYLEDGKLFESGKFKADTVYKIKNHLRL